MSAFNKRKTFFLNKSCSKSITLEISGFKSHPSIYWQMDASDNEATFHIGLFIGLWISIEGILPSKWFPKNYESKSIQFAFHNWSFWWDLWMDDNCWSRNDPKWRRGNIDFQKLFIGKHNCERTELSQSDQTISMIEGNYNVVVKEEQRIDTWPRWFTKKSTSWQVEAGYYENGEFVSCPIPVEGKGENSYDCDEDATYSMSFPAKGLNREEIKYPWQAALYFEQSIKEDRIKYGGKNWLPERFSKIKVQHIKKVS